MDILFQLFNYIQARFGRMALFIPNYYIKLGFIKTFIFTIMLKQKKGDL